MLTTLDFKQLDVSKNTNLKFCFFNSFPGRYDFHFPVGATECWIVYASTLHFSTLEEFASYVVALPDVKFDHYDIRSLEAKKKYPLLERTPEEILFHIKGVFDTYRDFTESYFLNVQFLLDPLSIKSAASLENLEFGTMLFLQCSDTYIGIVGE